YLSEKNIDKIAIEVIAIYEENKVKNNIDVDFFKKYNDLYGHQKGDSCLQAIAEVLSSSANRTSDFVARYGGEEFAIILPNTNRIDALNLSEKIHNKLKSTKLVHEDSSISDFVTLSMGLAVSDELKTCNPEKLINFADKALYVAKESGRNRTI
ncbi:MAG: diguanylate cyclase, partial [Poseidonibacter sp.]|uniref:diguanylate cyclase n=1 Tax=Poseidonibacter sp. TaxID=2321188 RepID=UPI00359E8F30